MSGAHQGDLALVKRPENATEFFSLAAKFLTWRGALHDQEEGRSSFPIPPFVAVFLTCILMSNADKWKME